MPTPWRQLAAALADAVTPVAGAEMVSLRGAAGRVLAEDVRAGAPVPNLGDHSVMDGFALGSEPPGRYRLVTDVARLAADEACVVQAGKPLPEGATRVVLARHASPSGGFIDVATAPGKDNIRRVGEECAAGDLILGAGLRLDARHLAFARIAGADRLALRHRPRIALAGVSDSTQPLPHLAVMQTLLDSSALKITDAGVVRGANLDAGLRRLAGCDLVVIVAESLGAEGDALASLLAPRQSGPVVHRAALKPAKPILFGDVAGTPVLGLAGTAYAVTAAAHLFLRPMLARLAGLPQPADPQQGMAAFARVREPGRAEALPVRAVWRNARLELTPSGRFGQLKALAALDGFGVVDADAGDIAEGSPMGYLPLTMPLI